MLSRRTWIASAAAAATAALGRRAIAQTPVVRFATSPAEGYAQPFFAQDAGIFAKNGVNADVQLLATGAAVSTALAGGAIDVGVGTVVSVANAIVRGIPFVMIAPTSVTTPKAPAGLLVVAKNSPIRSAKDLEGKTVAVPALRQVVDLALLAWLEKNGADPAKVQPVEAHFSDMGPGVERGTYAAAIISEPSMTEALTHNNVRSLADPYAALGTEYTVAGWITTKGFQQKNPEFVRKIADSLLEAARWANTHHDETAAIVSRIAKVPVETIRNEVRPVFADQLRVSDVQPQLDAALKYGYITRPVSAAELFGTTRG